jgi:hypothetical protein
VLRCASRTGVEVGRRIALAVLYARTEVPEEPERCVEPFNVSILFTTP